MIDIDRYVDFVTENNITEHQFLILWLVHTKDEKNITKYRKAFDHFDIDDITDLIDRGWIEDFGVIKDGVRDFNIYHFVVTDKFTEVVHIDTFEAGDELIRTYPNWLLINNKKISAKSCDHDIVAERYAKIIKNSRQKHDSIIKLIKRMKEKTEYVSMGIEKFVASRHWLLLEEELEENDKDMIMDL